MAKKAKKESVKPEAPAKASGKTVVVALNRVQGIDYPMPDGRVVSIAGNAVQLRGQEMGVLPVGAYGLTEVAESDWLYIEKTWGETRLFKSGLIFAQTKTEDAKAEAAERAELRNGFEPVDPERGAKTEPAKAGE